jgi:rhodanese-related sulfurtransferase
MTKSTVQTISAKDAHQVMLDNPKAIMIDVRSHMEFLFIGHPSGAINIAWIDEPDWIINPRFVAEIRQTILGGMSHIDSIESAPLILICRSGKRSLEAGELLVKEGFHNIYNVDEGFEGELNDEHKRSSLAGWRYDQLPWEQC